MGLGVVHVPASMLPLNEGLSKTAKQDVHRGGECSLLSLAVTKTKVYKNVLRTEMKGRSKNKKYYKEQHSNRESGREEAALCFHSRRCIR